MTNSTIFVTRWGSLCKDIRAPAMNYTVKHTLTDVDIHLLETVEDFRRGFLMGSPLVFVRRRGYFCPVNHSHGTF